MQTVLSKIWTITKSVLSVPLYFFVGMILLFILYYAVVYIGSDYNTHIIDIEHCRGVNGTWDYSVGRCKL